MDATARKIPGTPAPLCVNWQKTCNMPSSRHLYLSLRRLLVKEKAQEGAAPSDPEGKVKKPCFLCTAVD
jgi:hypothetical protein